MAYVQSTFESGDMIGVLTCYYCAEDVGVHAPYISLTEMLTKYNNGDRYVYIVINWDRVYSEGLMEYKEGMPIRFSTAMRRGIPWKEMCRWWE